VVNVNRARTASGFTLVELLIALLISTAIGALVFSVFVTQTHFYRTVTVSGRVQQTARGAVDLVATDVRAVARGGVLVAQPQRFAFRAPLALGVMCAEDAGGDAHAYFALDGRAIDRARVAGVAVRATSGAWAYAPVSGTTLIVSTGGGSVTACTDAGNVNSGYPSDYMLLDALTLRTAPAAAPGSVLVLYEELEYAFGPSALEPGTLGLFRGPYNGTLVEYASGFTQDAHFEYRVGRGSYTTSASGSSLAEVTAIRVVAAVAQTVRAQGRAAQVPYTAVVDVPLRNAR
jgi:prepilin-type N-terminal cleavage/methylation domain-containing protein